MIRGSCLCLPILLWAVQHDRKLLGSSVQHWCERQWAVLLLNVSSCLKTRAESNDETPWTGTWGWAGPIQCAQKESRFFCLCVDAPCMCKFDHSFLLHPKSKCPLFFPKSHMNAYYLSFKFWIRQRMVRSNSFKYWKILWLPATTPIAQSKRWEVFISQPNSESFLQKDLGWSCLQHEQAWILKQMDLTLGVGQLGCCTFLHALGIV